MRSILITEIEDNNYTVVCGESFQNGLCFDECLGLVATLIISRFDDVRRPLRLMKMEDVFEIERRIRNEIESKLRPVDRLDLEQKR